MDRKKILFISMLGESSHHIAENFKDICSSGLEKDWILSWYKNLAQKNGFQLSCVDICRNDSLPNPDTVHAAIVGGSAHLINEKRKWLQELTQWLVKYHQLFRPVLGICGGHQLISTRIFNGGFQKRRNGVLAGTFPVELTDAGKAHPLFHCLPSKPKFHFANSLHVVSSDEMKNGVLATHAESPAIAIDHGGSWYSVQFHPEATKQMLTCYCKTLDGFDPDIYTEDHDGNQLFENFFSIAKEFYSKKGSLNGQGKRGS